MVKSDSSVLYFGGLSNTWLLPSFFRFKVCHHIQQNKKYSTSYRFFEFETKWISERSFSGQTFRMEPYLLLLFDITNISFICIIPHTKKEQDGMTKLCTFISKEKAANRKSRQLKFSKANCCEFHKILNNMKRYIYIISRDFLAC